MSEVQHDLFEGPAIDRDTCLWCGEAATHLCDFHVGRKPGSDDEYEMWTCDAPICRECGVVWGYMRYQDGCDTVDVCPYHDECDERLAFRPGEGEVLEEGEVRRRRMVFYRRQRMRHGGYRE